MTKYYDPTNKNCKFKRNFITLSGKKYCYPINIKFVSCKDYILGKSNIQSLKDKEPVFPLLDKFITRITSKDTIIIYLYI